MVEREISTREDKEAFVVAVSLEEFPFPEVFKIAATLADQAYITKEVITDAVKNAKINNSLKVGAKNILFRAFDKIATARSAAMEGTETAVPAEPMAADAAETNNGVSSRPMPMIGRAAMFALTASGLATLGVVNRELDRQATQAEAAAHLQSPPPIVDPEIEKALENLKKKNQMQTSSAFGR
jgi:hypothetical protein